MKPSLALIVGATCLAIAGAAGGIWYATTGSAPLDTHAFTDRLETRVELGKGAEIRTVELYADKITPKHSVATRDDGSIVNYWYRADGTLEKAITEGVADAAGKRPRLRYAEIARDGVTYVLDVEYVATTGAKLKETHLTEANKLVRTYFHDNGVHRREQTIVRDKQGWKLTQEDQFRADATLAMSLRTADNDAWERKFFNEQSVLVSMKARGPFGTRYTEVNYQPDGKTKKDELEQNGSGSVLTQYHANGQKDEERTWTGPVSGASMRIVRYDQNGGKLYQQWWNYTEGKSVLWLLKVFRPADNTLEKNIWFDNADGSVTEVVYKGDGEYGADYTRRRFDKDGKLTLEEDEVQNKIVATRHFKPEDNIRMTLAPGYTTLRDVKTPPQVIPYSPPPMGGP